MGSKTLDEERHGDDEPDPHQQDRVPVGLLSAVQSGTDRQESLTVTHWAMVRRVRWLKRRFFSLTSGPSASTCVQNSATRVFSTAAIPQFPDQSETHLAAFKEDITVALEVITGRPGPEAELLHQPVPGVGAVLHPELGGLAGSVPTRDLKINRI